MGIGDWGLGPIPNPLPPPFPIPKKIKKFKKKFKNIKFLINNKKPQNTKPKKKVTFHFFLINSYSLTKRFLPKIFYIYLSFVQYFNNIYFI